jgi:hypothetical protein
MIFEAFERGGKLIFAGFYPKAYPAQVKYTKLKVR